MPKEQPEKGTQENPLTREDVLRLIAENGETAQGLDLSGSWFEEGIDASALNLHNIVLEKAWLIRANLHQTILEGANLQGAMVILSNLQQANLVGANLEGVDLRGSRLQGSYLGEARMSSQTKLEDVEWGNYVLGDEQSCDFGMASTAYRRLKQWYTNAGMYDVAGQFFFREMTVRRKALKWWPNPFPRLWSKFLSLICGYGERPERVIIWAATVILGLAGAYYFWGTFDTASFWDALYYSAASFTALGYGQWAPQPTGWAKGMGAAEAFIGAFSMALFLVTFTRKMTR